MTEPRWPSDEQLAREVTDLLLGFALYVRVSGESDLAILRELAAANSARIMALMDLYHRAHGARRRGRGTSEH